MGSCAPFLACYSEGRWVNIWEVKREGVDFDVSQFRVAEVGLLGLKIPAVGTDSEEELRRTVKLVFVRMAIMSVAVTKQT